MNNYELMVIFTPVLSEDDFKAAQKNLLPSLLIMAVKLCTPIPGV